MGVRILTGDCRDVLLADVRSALADCANDLAALLADRYRSRQHHPVIYRRWKRDMAVVERARDVLRRLDEAAR